MATQAKTAHKTKIQRDPGGGAWGAGAEIAELLDIQGPAKSHVMEDATNSDSPDGWAEKIAIGLKEAGDITFQMHFLEANAGHNALEADLEAGTLRSFRIILPSGTRRCSLTAYVQNIGPSYPLKSKLVKDVTLAVTGKPVWEAHS
jgi:hypothetical protein